MGWSSQFIDQLRSQQFKPIYKLQFLDLANNVGDRFEVFSFGSGFKIARSGIKVDGVRVIPGRWSSSFGGFTVDCVGNPRELFKHVAKGSFGELLCSINGSNFERIAIGQLVTITKQGFAEQYILTFKDLISAFQQTTNGSVGSTTGTLLPPQQPLFYTAGTQTFSTSTYNNNNVLSVNSTSNFLNVSGENGLLRIFPSASPSDDFYVPYSSTTSTSFATDIAIIAYPSIRLSSSCGSASRVISAVRLDGFPSDIIGSILTSTGTGGNGSLDKYPEEYSIGGRFNHSIFDKADADLFKQIIIANDGSAYKWRLVFTEPLTDGLRTILNTAAGCGQWAVMRQGSISWRGCQDPESGGIGGQAKPVVADRIEEYDIISIQSHEIFAAEQQNVFARSSVEFTTTLPIIDPHSIVQGQAPFPNKMTTSLPVAQSVQRSNVFTYSPDSDRAECAEGDLLRMRMWDFCTYEKITMTTTLSKAGLVAGDIVEITCRYLFGLKSPTKGSFKRTKAMVTGSSFDISNRRCILELCVLSGR